MRQQINLYQGELIDKPEPFQSRMAGLVLVGVAICLVLVSVFDYWQMTTLKKQLVPLQQQQRVATDLIISLEQQHPERKLNKLLEEKITRLEQEVQGQRKALDYFTTQDRGGNDLILGPLENLARYRQPGVWLQRISLLAGGRKVQLAGGAVTAEKVPEYLQLLGEKDVFGGQLFARLQLQRLEEHSGQVEFTLDSVTEISQ